MSKETQIRDQYEPNPGKETYVDANRPVFKKGTLDSTHVSKETSKSLFDII